MCNPYKLASAVLVCSCFYRRPVGLTDKFGRPINFPHYFPAKVFSPRRTVILKPVMLQGKMTGWYGWSLRRGRRSFVCKWTPPCRLVHEQEVLRSMGRFHHLLLKEGHFWSLPETLIHLPGRNSSMSQDSQCAKRPRAFSPSEKSLLLG